MRDRIVSRDTLLRTQGPLNVIAFTVCRISTDLNRQSSQSGHDCFFLCAPSETKSFCITKEPDLVQLSYTKRDSTLALNFDISQFDLLAISSVLHVSKVFEC